MSRNATKVILGVGLAALLAAGAVLMAEFTVSYECQVEFLYEDWPALPANGTSGVFGRSEDSRCQYNRRRIRLNEFNHPNGFYSLEEMMRRCLTDPVLRHENAQRSMNILSGRQFEVVEGSCLHSLCKYRLILTDAEKRNLDLYARLCLAVIKEQDAREREIRADKAARDENQEMKKAERRLSEMEKSIAQGSAKPGFEEELRQHRKMVDDLKARVDDIRLAALSTSARGIVYEFKPRLAWSIRRRTP